MSTNELSEAELGARNKAWVAGKNGRGFHVGWDAARDYYEERHVERMAPVVSALADAKGRERALRDALRAYSAAYSCPGILVDEESVSGCEGPLHDTDDCPTCAVTAALAASPQSDHGPGITAAQAETAAYLTATLGVPAQDGVVACKRGDQEFFLRPDGTLESGIMALAQAEVEGLPHRVGTPVEREELEVIEGLFRVGLRHVETRAHPSTIRQKAA